MEHLDWGLCSGPAFSLQSIREKARPAAQSSQPHLSEGLRSIGVVVAVSLLRSLSSSHSGGEAGSFLYLRPVSLKPAHSVSIKVAATTETRNYGGLNEIDLHFFLMYKPRGRSPGSVWDSRD